MGTPEVKKMRCHYEVMDLPRDCDAEAIKKAYKKMALKWHPDRNIGKEEEATECFKEVSKAYEVLSDPHERKWYDDHRAAILRGSDGTKRRDGGSGDGSDAFDNVADLYQFFNTNCYSGFDDTLTGFYNVYSRVFEALIVQENENTDAKGMADFPPFGDSCSDNSDVIKFYNEWGNFVSTMSFAWEDEYNTADAPSRQVRREIEKHNRKLRDQGRREFVDLVRSLVSFIRKRDPRMRAIIETQANKKAEETARRAKLREEELTRRAQQREELLNYNDEEENKRRAEEQANAFFLADESSSDEDDAHWAEAGGRVKKGKNRRRRKNRVVYEDDDEEEMEADNNEHMVGKVEASVEGDKGQDVEAAVSIKEEEVKETILSCEICDKSFKTDEAYKAHMKSKAHRQMEKTKSKKKGFVKRGVVDKEY